jgi:predicted transglutaminase-like protease
MLDKLHTNVETPITFSAGEDLHIFIRSLYLLSKGDTVTMPHPNNREIRRFWSSQLYSTSSAAESTPFHRMIELIDHRDGPQYDQIANTLATMSFNVKSTNADNI